MQVITNLRYVLVEHREQVQHTVWSVTRVPKLEMEVSEVTVSAVGTLLLHHAEWISVEVEDDK